MKYRDESNTSQQILSTPEKAKMAEELNQVSNAFFWMNVNKRSFVERVLVVGSTDGRLNVYYDERRRQH